MKRYLIGGAAVALTLLAAQGLSNTAAAAVCSTSGVSYSLWVDNPSFTCTVGDIAFSNFGYTKSGTNQVDDEAVTVKGITTITGEFGLEFDAPWQASGVNESSDAHISFTVTVTPPTNGVLIKDASLVQSGTGFIAPGIASVAEEGCGPSPCTPVQWQLFTIDSSSTTRLADSTSFTPNGSEDVVKDIAVTSGNGGSAAISIVQDTFSQTSVPEPASLALLATGLVGLGWVSRRRRTGF